MRSEAVPHTSHSSSPSCPSCPSSPSREQQQQQLVVHVEGHRHGRSGEWERDLENERELERERELAEAATVELSQRQATLALLQVTAAKHDVVLF